MNAQHDGPGETAGTPATIEVLRHRIAVQEAVIEEQRRAIEGYRDRERTLAVWRRYHPGLRALRLARRLVRRWLPGLGQLRQHAPRPLRLPVADTRLPDAPPSITIVTPNLDGVAFLERALRSVLDQGYPALEYVIQDGGSRDGSRAVIEHYAARVQRVNIGPDGGRTEALNRAFAHTTGSIMAWLSSDDLLLPGSLACVARYFDANPEVDVLYGHRILIDANDMEIGRWVLPAHDDEILSWADFVPQETLFWRRALWDRIGARVDERFRFALDWDLLLRFRDAGARFARVPRFLGAFRVHEMQQTIREMETTGRAEMAILRERSLGRAVPEEEVQRACAGYRRRAVWHALMRRLGVVSD